MKNSIFVIKPYKWEGLWVFDDPAVGLVKEPFVGGADTMIDVATVNGSCMDTIKKFLAESTENAQKFVRKCDWLQCSALSACSARNAYYFPSLGL